MKLRTKEPGVYIQVSDRWGRKKSKAATVYGVTPTQMIHLIRDAVAAGIDRKAG